MEDELRVGFTRQDLEELSYQLETLKEQGTSEPEQVEFLSRMINKISDKLNA